MIIIYKKILLAIDGSDHANNAAKQVAEFQKKWNSKVVIFHSIKLDRLPSEVYPDFKFLASIYSNFEELCKEAGKHLLDKTKKKFDEAQSSIETRLIEDEAPEDYIKNIVKEENFDLVVLGAKGHHSKIKEILLGTVLTKVVKCVQCDILIVK